jgi:Fur family zinc uptake transcriptional regulator/Fur family ferric uptake transcriptional regulator
METFEATLKRLKLKVTPRRLAVMDVIARESTFLSPEEVWERLKGKLKSIGLPTVYRILEELAEGGVVTRVMQDSRQLYYYFCRNKERHHHFICVACRRVEDVNQCMVDALEEEGSERIKGKLFSHILQLQGLCAKCSAKEAKQ